MSPPARWRWLRRDTALGALGALWLLVINLLFYGNLVRIYILPLLR